jgi:hypothetical protein
VIGEVLMASVPRSRSSLSLRATGPAFLLAVAVLAGCSPGAGAAGSQSTSDPALRSAAPTSVPAPPTTDARSAAEAAVLAAYRAYWDDVVAVGATADWQSPRLAEHATGQALAETRTFLQELKAKGLVARGSVKVDAKVLSLSPGGSRAVVYDCNSTSDFLAYDAKTGQLRDKSSGRSNGKTVVMELQRGTWKLVQVMATEPGRCTK